MTKTQIRTYVSPTLVLLAFNWDDGANHPDFLGFAIQRSPGFSSPAPQFLANKIGFDPPAKAQSGSKPRPFPSNQAPFQKFQWWDSGIKDSDRGKTFTYTVIPVQGTGKNDLHLQMVAAESVAVKIPHFVENGIGTYFNRAVVSSQAFSEMLAEHTNLDNQMAWLANGMQNSIVQFLADYTSEVHGAVYHLTDNEWVGPKLDKYPGKGSFVLHWHEGSGAKKSGRDVADKPAMDLFAKHGGRISSHKRTKTSIMHDKFLVGFKNGEPTAVLMGSANFTPEGLTSQANVIHTWASPDLAKLYDERQKLLAGDPTKGETAKHAGWSKSFEIGDAKVRVFFPPEPTKAHVSIDEVVKVIKAAKRSVMFCLFSPTDPAMLEALLAAGDEGKLMFGLLNAIKDPTTKKPVKDPEKVLATKPSAASQMQVTVFNRSRKDKKIVDYDRFTGNQAPAGFLPEQSTIDTSSKVIGAKPKQPANPRSSKIPPVHIHHKFIVVDGETSNPTIFVGSANMSNNSVHNNDENLLEITGSKQLGQAYVAEFLRLYDHYRARALWDWSHNGGKKSTGKKKGKGAKATATNDTFILKTTRDAWVKDAYKTGTAAFLLRTDLAKAAGA